MVDSSVSLTTIQQFPPTEKHLTLQSHPKKLFAIISGAKPAFMRPAAGF
jgi:hypothetical protein